MLYLYDKPTTMAKTEILSVRTPDGLKDLLQEDADQLQGKNKKEGNLSTHVIEVLQKSVKKNNKNK